MCLETHFLWILQVECEIKVFAYADYTKTDLPIESQFRMQMSSNCKSHVTNITKYEHYHAQNIMGKNNLFKVVHKSYHMVKKSKNVTLHVLKLLL